MAPNPRIEELRKRLEKEPASRLFAQLAEELRKDGALAEAIRLCRDGLQKHPNYPSARMTLGRALLDTGDLSAARTEFDAVLKAAPDNILASRFLAECDEGLGDIERAEAQYKATLRLSPGDKQVAARLEAINQRRRDAASGSAATSVMSVAVSPPPPSAPIGIASIPGIPAPPPGMLRPASAPVSPPRPPVPTPVSAPAPPPPPPVPSVPPPMADPPPIPLVAADEEFELERSYEAPTRPTTGERALAQDFARASQLAVTREIISEPTIQMAPVETESETTARFTALDEEAMEAAVIEEVTEAPAAAPSFAMPESQSQHEHRAGPPVDVNEPTPRAGLETLFRFSALEVADAVAAEAATPQRVAPPPVPLPPVAQPAIAPPPLAPPLVAPPPMAVRPTARTPPPFVPPPAPPPPVHEEAEIVSSTMAELYYSQGHIDKAIDLYRKLLRGGPDNEKARLRLIELESEAAGGGVSREERRAAIERTIARLETLLTVLRKE